VVQTIAAMTAIFLLGGQTTDASAEATVIASGVPGGLIVKIGCGDVGDWTRQRIHERFLVHVLDSDAAQVAVARAFLKTKAPYGRVSVDTFDGQTLPYVDNLVNLLIVDSRDNIPLAEVLRVLTPRGVAMIKGEKIIKPDLANTDVWTHYLHGPSNNAVANDSAVGPPRHLQWVGSPRWTRDHHTLNSISSTVTVGGRLFFILDGATGRRMNLPGEWVLVARDAFNGVELWRIPLASWAQQTTRFRSGPPQLPRLLVASEEHV